MWIIGKKELAISTLEKAVKFLETSEVFYEMWGRAFLADFYFQNNLFELAAQQVKIIENPSGDYISFETKTLASMIKAKLLQAGGNLEESEKIKNQYLASAQKIGAMYLETIK